MLARISIALVLLCCGPAWCQVETAGADGSKAADVDTQLQVPPPVSGQAYPTEFVGETETNYWQGGFTLSSAYSNNVTGSTNTIADMSYSFWPNISLNKSTSRMQLSLNYAPGLTVYQRASAYNQANQNVNAEFQFLLSPNLRLSAQESFTKTSNVFNQPAPLSATPVSGSFPTPGVAVITPVADQNNNATGAQLTYQVGATSMVGVGGTFSKLYYPNPQEVYGLFDSRTAGGSAFYSHRLGERYYLGISFQYQNISSYQVNLTGSDLQTQTIFAFLSFYLKPNLSISVSGGPQHYMAAQQPFPSSSSWSPMVMTSIGWQGTRTTLSASYAYIVTGGGGLNGAFRSNTAGASANWQITRDWSAGIGAAYNNSQSLTPLFLYSSGGRSISGTASAQRALGEHANLQFGYSWTDQKYEQIPVVSGIPNTNRVFVSIHYQFTRPLHR